MPVSQSHGLMMTTGQHFGLAMLAVAIDRTHGMDDVFGCEPSARGDHGVPGRKIPNLAHDLTALGENSGPTGAMNGAIHSTAAQQR